MCLIFRLKIFLLHDIQTFSCSIRTNYGIFAQNNNMKHSIIDVRKYRRAMGYGDFKAIKERLQAKGITVSKTAITQVMQEVYYNQAILDEVAIYLGESSTPKEEE